MSTSIEMLCQASGDFLDLIKNYWKIFECSRNEMKCSTELARNIDQAIGRIKTVLCTMINSSQSNRTNPKPNSSLKVSKERLNNLHSYITAQQISRFIGLHRLNDNNQLLEIARDLIIEWKTTLDLNSKKSSMGDTTLNNISNEIKKLDFQKKKENENPNDDQREVQHGDDLLLLAAHIFIELSIRYTFAAQQLSTSIEEMSNNKRKGWSFLVDAIVAAELGLKHSAFNFQMKLVVIRVYNVLGAFSSAMTRFKELDIKHIQIETLSYVALDNSIATGFHDNAIQMCESIESFHGHSSRCIPKYTSTAYKYGNVCQVREFFKLKEKLRRSHQLVSSQIDLFHLNMMKLPKYSHQWLKEQFMMGHLKDIPMTELEKLLETEDRNIASSWDAPIHALAGIKNAENLKGSATPQIQKIEAVDLRIRCLYPILLMLSSSFTEEKRLKEKLVEFKRLVKTLHEIRIISPNKTLHEKIMQGTFQMKCNCYEIIADAFDIALDISSLMGTELSSDVKSELRNSLQPKLISMSKRLTKLASFSAYSLCEEIDSNHVDELCTVDMSTIDWGFRAWDIIKHGDSVPLSASNDGKGLRGCWIFLMHLSTWLTKLIPEWYGALQITGSKVKGKNKSKGKNKKGKKNKTKKSSKGNDAPISALKNITAVLDDILMGMAKQAKVAQGKLAKGLSPKLQLEGLGLGSTPISALDIALQESSAMLEKLHQVRMETLRKISCDHKEALSKVLKAALDGSALLRKIRR